MKIYTRKHNPKIHRNELKLATSFMFAHLVEENIHKKTTVFLYSHPIKAAKNLCGLTTVINEHNNQFKIEIDTNLSRKKQLITLGHELVHVKQYINNELGENLIKNNMSMTKWKGAYFNEEDAEYWDWPWEIEAHGREYGLFKRWELWSKEEKIDFKHPLAKNFALAFSS